MSIKLPGPLFFFFVLLGFVFCDSYYPTDPGGGSRGGQHGRGGTSGEGPGGGGQHGPRGAWAGKDWAGGSSTGALCTRFTLVI